MNANRLVVRLYSVVAILAAMIYLSGVAMAQPPKKENKHDGNKPVPEHDSFDNDGSDTFENSPTPTYPPAPPRPEKKNDKEKEQKEKKEKKDKDDGVITIQSASPDLKYVSVVVTPVGDVAGGSGVTGQAATITVTIINANSAAAGAFRLDTWKHLPSPPNFGSIGDFSQTFAGLAGNTSLSVSYSFSMANSYGTYFPRSTVDSGSLVAETSEANNTNTGSYTVIEMASVVPPTINTISGASVVFRGVAKPYGKKWPVNQPSAVITVPGVGSVTVPHNGTATLAGVGTFGPIVRNLIGDASLTSALAEGFGGTATVTFVCGTSTASGELRSVCLGVVSPSGTIIAAGKSLTFTVQTNPAGSTWPSGAPTATVTPPEAGTLSSVGTTTGSATATFFSHGTFGGVVTITFSYGGCSSSTTLTTSRIQFVDYDGDPIFVVPMIGADYLMSVFDAQDISLLPPKALFQARYHGGSPQETQMRFTVLKDTQHFVDCDLIPYQEGVRVSQGFVVVYTGDPLPPCVVEWFEEHDVRPLDPEFQVPNQPLQPIEVGAAPIPAGGNLQLQVKFIYVGWRALHAEVHSMTRDPATTGNQQREPYQPVYPMYELPQNENGGGFNAVTEADVMDRVSGFFHATGGKMTFVEKTIVATDYDEVQDNAPTVDAAVKLKQLAESPAASPRFTKGERRVFLLGGTKHQQDPNVFGESVWVSRNVDLELFVQPDGSIGSRIPPAAWDLPPRTVIYVKTIEDHAGAQTRDQQAYHGWGTTQADWDNDAHNRYRGIACYYSTLHELAHHFTGPLDDGTQDHTNAQAANTPTFRDVLSAFNYTDVRPRFQADQLGISRNNLRSIYSNQVYLKGPFQLGVWP